MHPIIRTLSLSVVSLTAAAAIAGTAIAAEGAIKVSDQKVEGSTVTIAGVTMPEAGFVAIHGSDANGKMKAPEAVGMTQVEAGENEDVKVDLTESVEPGTKLYVMLHKDTGEKGKYEFVESGGKEDGPVTVDGKPVITPFEAK